jgi:hypothetical protein
MMVVLYINHVSLTWKDKIKKKNQLPKKKNQLPKPKIVQGLKIKKKGWPN